MQSSNDSYWPYILPFLSVLLGGVIAVFSSWLTTNRQFAEERRRKKKETDDKVKALLSSLYHELDTVWNRYQASMGVEIEKIPADATHHAFLIRYPLISEYFPIYHANADKIGLIPDAALRADIVEVSIFAKALMDSYKMNNLAILEKMAANNRYYDSMPGGIASTTDAGKQNDHAKLMLEDYGPKLRALHMECKGKAEPLLTKLKAYGVS